MDHAKNALRLHKKHQGKIEMAGKVHVRSPEDLSWAYTPGVAAVSRAIAEDKTRVYEYTNKANSVAVLTDGSAVLGLGNIGPEAALPVMEGKALLFKELAGIDAFPICVKSQDPQDIIMIARNIAPVFGGINLEDISGPKCFAVEESLQDLGIPVMHDDQHGTAVVVLAASMNALQIVGKKLEESRIVINGAGAAGTAIFSLLRQAGAKNIVVCDSQGVIHQARIDLTHQKQVIAKVTGMTNPGTLSDALKNADMFIGVSVKGALTKEMVSLMAKGAIILAMANPDPEILPADAIEAGAAIVGTGRSDFPNQVNNVLGFPGIFRGALDARATRITLEMKLAAAEAIAKLAPEGKILPSPLDRQVVPAVASAVKHAWQSGK